MIVLSLYDGKEQPIEIRGTHREAAIKGEEFIRKYRLVDGHVGIQGEGRSFPDVRATRILMHYLGTVIAEVYDEAHVEASYSKIDPYAIAKYPRRQADA
jgi:hypothetical protein